MNHSFTANVIWRGTRRVAVALGVRDSLVRSLLTFKAWKRECRRTLRYQLFRRQYDRKAASGDITAVVLTMDPSRSYQQCVEAVRNQRLQPAGIAVVRNVQPFSKASQAGLDQVQTPFYVSVDDDMILDRSCFERLYFVMKTNPHCADAVVHLNDPLLGEIQGVHMYRTEPVRQIGFHPLVGEKGCERKMSSGLRKAGYTKVAWDVVAGDHHPEYLPHEAFWKFHFEGEKARFYHNATPDFRDCVDRLASRWAQTHDDTVLYALAGLFRGIESADVDRELSYENRDEDLCHVRLHAFLREHPAGESSVSHCSPLL